MSDSLSLYRTLLEFVWQNGVRFHDLRCLMTFVWALVGLLLSQQIHLSQWALYRPGRAKAGSKQRQLARWLHNRKINPSQVYGPLIKQVLRAWTNQRLFLALDSSSLWGRFTVVRLALIYRGRALPLTWRVLSRQSASVGYADYQIILRQAADLLPAKCQVILLADRGFVDVKLFQLARDLGWSFRVRLKQSLWVYRANKPRTKVGRLMPARGQARFVPKVWLTEQQFGPVYLALAHVQTANGYEQWAIVSDEPTDLQTLTEYGFRFDIEENFLDDKSAGFQLEASEIQVAEALARLLLILAVATVYLVNSGVAVVTTRQRHQVDAHWQRGLSYLQLGWRWLRQALSQGKRLFKWLWLKPGPDPDPVFASAKQVAQPIAIISAIQLLI
ncbi:MAG TPA: transposase [Anaerolineae bacterium]|nr:transposase [Anaerolineae bacterium]